MKESDLQDLLPPERSLPPGPRRAIKEALMAQTRPDLHRPVPDDAGGDADADAEGDRVVDLGPVAPGAEVGRRRRRGPSRVAAVAAAGLALAGTAAAVALAGRTDLPEERTKPDVTVEGALATSSGALAESGRVECAFDDHHGDRLDRGGSVTYAFSGDDRLNIVAGEADGEPFDKETRLIDGEIYDYLVLDPATDPDPHWYHWTEDIPLDSVADLFGLREGPDPAVLFDQLADAGPFDEVGAESVDGDAVRRLRATHPEKILSLCGEYGPGPNTVQELDIWVGDDGFVDRVEGRWQGLDAPSSSGTDSSGSFAVSFSGYDDPVTIEVPPDAIDASVTQIVN